MNLHPQLSYAIAAILNGSAAGYAYAAPAATTDVSSDSIQEITVTAQRWCITPGRKVFVRADSIAARRRSPRARHCMEYSSSRSPLHPIR